MTERDSIIVTYFKAPDPEPEELPEKDESPTIEVCLNVKSFVYNQSTNKFTIKLENAKVIRSDYYGGSVTLEMDENVVNKQKSDDVVYAADIDEVMEEIEKRESTDNEV